MRLLLVLALLAAGGWFAPQVTEKVAAPCPALERRAATVLEAGPGGPVPAAQVMAAQMMAATRGGLAEAMVRERLPQLPPGAGCVVGWWRLVLDRDPGAVLRGMLAR